MTSKADEISQTTRKLSNRTLTNASRARVRYVGGYCIAKIRHKHVQKKKSNRFLQGFEANSTYENSKIAVDILNTLKEEENYLLASTEDPQSLKHTYNKQNLDRSLTNISDGLFKFFLQLTKLCLELLTSENLNKVGNKIYEYCMDNILANEKLYQMFTNCSTITSYSHMKKLYKDIIKLFLSVMLNQFKKDLLDSFKVEKKWHTENKLESLRVKVHNQKLQNLKK